MNKNNLLNFLDRFDFIKNNSNQTIFLDGEKNITAKEFLQNLISLTNLWKQQLVNKDRIALIVDDFYLFICAWFVCQILNKKVIILPNNQKGTLKILAEYYDTIIYDKDVVFSSDFECLEFDINIHKNSKTIFFTSGSSGTHKAYSKTLKDLEAESFAIKNCLNNFLSENTNIYATVSYQHLYGFSFYFIYAFLSGFIIQTQRLISPENVLNKLVKDNSLIITTPLMISHLDKKCQVGENTLVISSASSLSNDDALSFFNKYQKEVLEVYGSTETGVIAYRKQLTQPQWKCFSGVAISKDRNSQLIVKSDFCSQESQFMADRVDISSGNSFKLLGRIDRVIKLAGKRLSLSAMENTLKQHQWIQDSSCVLCKSYREYVGAMLVLSQEGRQELINLGRVLFTRKLREYLLDFYSLETLPKKWRIESEIPINTQGKKVLSEVLEKFN